MSLFQKFREVDFGGIQVPIEIITQATGTFGIRGSGKTTTATVLCEGLLEHGQQVVIVDPLDGWFGLKSSSDGTKPAYPVIVLGGRHQDLPLNAEDGNVLADFVVDEGASVILSLRHFESQADQRKFVTDFTRRLFYKKGQAGNSTPLLVVIDEASLFVPQRVGAQEAQMVGAIQKLVRQGRSSGIGVMLVDQRPASVNKDVLSQIELLITHRVTSPHDLKALRAWVEQHDEEDRGEKFRATLPTLERGHAWFWSPAWLNVFKLAKVRPRRTFDSSATPKIGEVRREPTAKAEINLDALKEKLTKTIERAKEEDPELLKARVRELEAEVKEAKKAFVSAARSKSEPVPVREVERVIERLPTELYGEMLEFWRKLDADFKRMTDDLAHLRERHNELGALVEKARFAPNVKEKNGRQARRDGLYIPAEYLADGKLRFQIRGLSDAEIAEMNGVDDGVDVRTISKVGSFRGERRVLLALAQLGGVAQKTDLAVYACYKYSAGGFQNILTSLRKQKLVEDADGGAVKLTTEGVKAAPVADAYLDTSQIRAEWEQKLMRPARLALGVLAHVHPNGISKKEIAERTGYVASAGGFQNGLTQLRQNGLVEETKKDMKLVRVLAMKQRAST